MSKAKLPPEALAQLAAVTDGALRVGPLQGIPGLLRDLGADPDRVFAAAELNPGLLDDAEGTIPFGALGRLMSQCVEHTGCPHFGLLLGQRTGLPALGLVGHLGQHSPDLGTALRNMILHLHIHDRGAIPSLTVEHGCAVVGYTIYQPAAEATAQIYDSAIAITNNILHTLHGPGWHPSEVLLARAKPADPEPYRKVFQAPIRFGAEQSAVSSQTPGSPSRSPARTPACSRRSRAGSPPSSPWAAATSRSRSDESSATCCSVASPPWTTRPRSLPSTAAP